MLMHLFYCGLTKSSKSYVNGQRRKTFMELTASNAHILLDELPENKIKISLEKMGTREEHFNDRYELYNLNVEEKQVDKVKMLSDKINESLLDLDKCSFNELMNILIFFANDLSFNVHQTEFTSYIANHVMKEKIQRCIANHVLRLQYIWRVSEISQYCLANDFSDIFGNSYSQEKDGDKVVGVEN
jgi:hypothetical protein